MRRKQLIILIGMVAAAAVMAFGWNELEHWSLSHPVGEAPAERLAFAVHWLLAPGLTLFAGVAAVACGRFFFPAGIDGSRTPDNRVLEILLRYNQNTLEQTMLAAIAWTGLALVLPHDRLALISGMALLFVTGRVLFLVGYWISPPARAFGFALTAYPTFAALFWLAARALG